MTASTRRFPRAGILLLATTLQALLPLVAFGNGGPVYSYDGNQIVPLSSDDVQLVQEVVNVDLSYQHTGHAACRYLLRNLTQQEVNLSIAFIWSREVTPESGREFRAWVGEDPTPVRWMPADQRRWWDYTGIADVDSLPVWDIRIPSKDSVSVRCEYPVQFEGHVSGGGFREGFSYNTKAAGLWAGVVESADFEIDLGDDWRLFFCRDLMSPPYVESDIQPAGYRWNGSTLRWRFEDWEPSEDIALGLYSAFALRWEEFFECREDSEVSCWYPIDLPAFTADSLLYAQEPLLQAIRDAFTRQFAAEPIVGNYEGFAHAYLEALRLEISARHGARIDDERIARFFEVHINYAADPTFDRSRLNATELANEDVLLSLQQRIEQSPELLLPLPASK